MGDLIRNIDPKKNPVTSLIGGFFLVISAAMYVVKYLVPAFFVLKQDIPFDWYVPLIVLFIGLLLIFINDEYFARIFGRADKIISRKTGTDDGSVKAQDTTNPDPPPPPKP